MTPFMLKVSEVLAGGEGEPLALRESVPRTVGEGAHEHVELRALAEQLVAEANAVLAAETGETIRLEDSAGALDQGFLLAYRENWARVGTSFDRGTALAVLAGAGLGERAGELDGEDALAALITTLIGGIR